MSLRKEQCNKVCRILDDVLANRPNERDSLIIATREAFAEPRWIPVTERLPKPDEEVFVYLWDNVPFLASMNSEGRWATEHFYLDVEDAPKAWMPLPEPMED